MNTRNTTYGFQPTAIVQSIPQAAFVWASFLFIIQGFWMTFGDVPGRVLLSTIVLAGVLIIGCFDIWVALH